MIKKIKNNGTRTHPFDILEHWRVI